MFRQLKLNILAVGMALVLPAAGWGDVNFAQKPLAAGGGVDPNLLFILDDSGSMRWGFMPDDLDEHFDIGGYGSNCGNNGTYGGMPLCYYYTNNGRQFLASSHLNKLYFNPSVTYAPPLAANGASFPNASFTNASVNGYNSDANRVNLSNNYRAVMDDFFYKQNFNRGFAVSHNANSEPAFYYRFNNAGGCESDPYQDSCYTKVVVAASEHQNFANWFSYYRTREMAAKAGIGTVFANQDLSTDFRLGWGQINQERNTVDDAANVRAVTNGVRSFDSVRANFINWLYGVSSTGATPSQRALEGAGQYFEKSERAWLDDPGSSKSSANPARECRISATMLMTDGYYNTGTSYDPDLSINADNVDGPVITNDTGDTGQYKAESPFSDTVTSRVTLADIAAHYWKRDLRTDIDNYVPTISAVTGGNDSDVRKTVGNPAFWQHMMTYGIGFGVEGTVSRDDAVSAALNGTGVDWWGGSTNENKINDLLHASMNGRGDFFSAGDPGTFRSQLEGLLDQFLGNAGSATGVDFNVASIEAENALVFSSYFEPNGWTGDLEAITLESGSDGRPEIAEDEDNEGWSARARLNAAVPDNRKILTYDGSQGQPFRWGSLSNAQKNDLNTGTPSLGEKRLEYLRGKKRETLESENEGDGKYFRQRQHLLGTIVNSTPRYVGVPDSFWPNNDTFGDGKYSIFRNSNLERTPVVYVGANDGMLHGFKATSLADGGGDEVLAYVPSFIASTADEEGLHYLTKPGFSHRFYVDLNLEVVDVHTRGRRANGNVDNTRDWRTVLIGGSRAGAKGIFALDVTNPDDFSEANAGQQVLWEFTHEKLGYLVEPPEIAQMEWPDGNIRWTVFVSSGYNSGSTGFFMLDLEGGLDGTWDNNDYMYFEFKSGGTGLSPLTLIDNVNANYLVDRVYAGDLDGNLWVAENDEGTMKSAYTELGQNSPYFKAAQPITSAPAVALSMDTGKDPDLMILFGTGKYLETGDHSNNDDQYFYAVHETSDAGALPITIDRLVDLPVTQQAGTIDGVDRTIRVASENRVDYDVKRGWYSKLPSTGERVVNYPIIRGEYVYVNTLIPGGNPCLGGGDGWVMGFEILRAENTTPGFPAFENSTENATGFKVNTPPSQLSVWGNLLAFNSGAGGAQFVGLPELIIGLGRKGWREITE